MLIELPISNFLQEEPDNLQSPTETTEVRLLYDNENIYVYVHLFDNEPDKIVGRFARRDDWFEGFHSSSDWFSIDFDSRHDHQTAYSFSVNSKGVQWDAMVLEDSFYDDDWDGIWFAETTIDSLGWELEIQIPFSVLRYSKDNPTWGIKMERYIQRKNEYIKIPALKRGTKGEVSQFSHLIGLEKLPSHKIIEFKPYILNGSINVQNDMLVYPDSIGNVFRSIDNNDYTKKGGFGLKYHLTSNSIIDFTFNPDFGQIEADPSLINLTAYETRFIEKRPFFMENSGIFDTPIEIFYSRRIGENIDSVKIDGELIPDSLMEQNTKLVTATKVTGKTPSGYTYGLIYGITENTFHKKFPGDKKNINNYFITRLKKDILLGNSYYGIMSSNMSNSIWDSKNISLDGTFFLINNQLEISSQLVQSNNDGVIGTGFYGLISYHDLKYFNILIESDYYDKKFALENTGYLPRNNLIKNLVKLVIRKQTPGDIIRYTSFGIEYNQEKNLNNLLLANEIQFEYILQFTNYWSLISYYYHNTEHYDDLLTFDYDDRKIGPITKIPKSNGYSLNISSDDSKSLSGNISFGSGSSEFGDKKNTILCDLFFEPNNYATIHLGYEGIRSKEKFHWLEIIEINPMDDEDADDSLRFIFSESDNNRDIFTLRLSFNYTNELSFQFYSEYFLNNNNFYNYSELFEDNKYPLPITDESQNPYTETSNFPFPDNKFLNPNHFIGLYPKYEEFNANFIFKWGFSPGSNLYLVYSINKFVNGKMFYNLMDFLNYSEPGDWEEIYYNHSLFLKVDYWFNF